MDNVSPTVNVSRETMDRLNVFHDLLLKWNQKINLISKSSIPDVWVRHIWDSAQVFPLAEPCKHWVDIGSGGGFPGLIVSILACEFDPNRNVVMVESDQRKSTFLRTVIRELDLNASVVTSRVEGIKGMRADVLSARALSDLSDLMSHAERHLKPEGRAFFFKGEKWESEVEVARQAWSFSLTAHKSKTNPDAAILEIKEIQRA